MLIAGVLEALLVGGDARRRGDLPRLRWPRLDLEVKGFLKRFGPATVGSAETQIALFADTIIASFLATGALSALYYADRLNQLPIGVIGIAAGTVLLPEMARRIAAGDERGARHAQNRAVELTLLLSIPCVVAFLLVPELIMRALFVRGAFTAADAQAAAATLAAYAIGLLPFVLLRSVTVTFLARGDTLTPVKALAVAVAVNVALKILLMDRYAQVGLALATSIGAWVNLALLLWFAARKSCSRSTTRLKRSAASWRWPASRSPRHCFSASGWPPALFAGWPCGRLRRLRCSPPSAPSSISAPCWRCSGSSGWRPSAAQHNAGSPDEAQRNPGSCHAERPPRITLRFMRATMLHLFET